MAHNRRGDTFKFAMATLAMATTTTTVAHLFVLITHLPRTLKGQRLHGVEGWRERWSRRLSLPLLHLPFPQAHSLVPRPRQ